MGKNKKLKFYINDESKLNEYEKEHKKISYATLCDYLFESMILCNNIEKLEGFWDGLEIGNIYDEETDTYVDIYQFFIVDFPNFNYDFMQKYLQNDIILFYNEELDLYILGVDHFGTGWSYVLTDIEYTTDYENSMQGQLYKD